MPGTMLGPENSVVEDPRLFPLRSSRLLRKTEKLIYMVTDVYLCLHMCAERGVGGALEATEQGHLTEPQRRDAGQEKISTRGGATCTPVFINSTVHTS